MPKVPIKDLEQYARAIEVLTDVGGWWHGVGREERFLLVNQQQYEALVAANVTSPLENEDNHNGTKKKRKNK